MDEHILLIQDSAAPVCRNRASKSVKRLICEISSTWQGSTEKWASPQGLSRWPIWKILEATLVTREFGGSWKIQGHWNWFYDYVWSPNGRSLLDHEWIWAPLNIAEHWNPAQISNHLEVRRPQKKLDSLFGHWYSWIDIDIQYLYISIYLNLYIYDNKKYLIIIAYYIYIYTLYGIHTCCTIYRYTSYNHIILSIVIYIVYTFISCVYTCQRHILLELSLKLANDKS